MNNPPFELELRSSIDVERNVTHLAHGAVKLNQVRQRLFVIRSLFAFFEYKRGIGCIVSNQVRFDRRHVILAAQQFGHLIEEPHALLLVIRSPHRCFQTRDLVGIEFAHVRRAWPEKIVKDRADHQRENQRDHAHDHFS